MANGTLAASQIEMLSLSGTGIITITPPATNTNRAITLPDAAGALVVSGTTPSLNGITFPATQVPSADANTLDDYEEGAWTPVLAPSVGTITSQSVFGSYIKIGNQVTLTFKAIITGGTVTNISTIGGFPFASANANEQACGAARETQVAGAIYQIEGVANTVTANVRRYDNSTVVTNSYGWQGSITYITA